MGTVEVIWLSHCGLDAKLAVIGAVRSTTSVWLSRMEVGSIGDCF